MTGKILNAWEMLSTNIQDSIIGSYKYVVSNPRFGAEHGPRFDGGMTAVLLNSQTCGAHTRAANGWPGPTKLKPAFGFAPR